MLTRARRHKDYLNFMLPGVGQLYLEKPNQILFFLDVTIKSYILNLDSGMSFLKRCYSKDWWDRPTDYDPIDLFRSMILMVSLGITSITEWANYLRSYDVLSIVSGFEPGMTHSVGTFYEF